MSRKDYIVIAEVFRHQDSILVPGSPEWIQNRDCAEAMSRALLTASKYDINGNKSFKPDVFLKACGIG